MLITTSVLDQYFRQDYTICMMNKNPVNPVNLVILSLLVFVIQHTTFAQTVDKLIQREMRERRVPGLQLAVVRDGKLVLSKSFGTVTNKTVFPIYSCTKAFTGVAIMQLVEDGKVELSAPVSRYLEGLPPQWQGITIRQLLTHVNVFLYPNSANVYDSVAEAYAVNGNRELAIKNYKRSLELDPKNTNAVEQLKKLNPE